MRIEESISNDNRVPIIQKMEGTSAPHEWHTPQVNKHQVWKAYVDSYDNHAFGILQEDGQNSFDAYPPATHPKDMKVVIRYDADERQLQHRDFRTTGMPHCRECKWGIRDNKVECTNTECSWGCYHNMGYTGKGGTALGSRGMGKALQLLAGTRTIVKTTLPDGRFQASLWERASGDWQWRFAPEFAKRLTSPGMEVITYITSDPVHEQLLDHREVIAELQERWFRLLSQGAKIIYLLVKDGRQKRFVVREPSFPPLDTSQGEDKARRVDPKIVVTYQGKRLGELRNLHLFLAKKPFPERDRTWGIAIVKNGKQTITRFISFPEEIPEGVRKRLFGYCDAMCTAEEPFLKDAETAQHTGYQWSHTTYRSVRRALREIVRQFVQPFLRAGGKRVTAKEQAEAKEILAIFNKALADVPDFSFFGKEMIAQKRRIVITLKDYVYLSRLEFENRSYRRGDRVSVEAVIKNPTERELLVRTVFEHFDPTPVVVEFAEDAIILPPGTPETPGTRSVSWQLTLEPTQAPGIHWIQVSLQDATFEPLVDNEEHPIRGRRSIYCELQPKKILRTRSGAGDPTEGTGTGGGEGAFGLAAIQWFKKPDMRDALEAYVDMSQAIAFVNARGRRLEFARKGSKSKRVCWPVVGEVIAEKILELKAALDAGEKEQWSAEEVKDKIVELETMKAKLVRRMVELLGG